MYAYMRTLDTSSICLHLFMVTSLISLFPIGLVQSGCTAVSFNSLNQQINNLNENKCILTVAEDSHD